MDADITERKSNINSQEESISESEHHDKFIESLKGKIRTVTVEPIVICYTIILYIQTSVTGQYILYRIGVDYNITHNEKLAHVCNTTANQSDKDLTDRIQSINAQYSMIIELCSCVCTIIAAPFFCVFSDRFGRKPMFLIPGVGTMMKSVAEVLIILYDWPIWLFAITQGCYGFFGGFPFVSGLSFSYIADISTSKQRTKRIATLGIIQAVGALVISLVVGFWIAKFGYLSPYVFSGIVSFLCVLYPILYLKESPKMHDSNEDNEPILSLFKRLFTIYWNRPNKQRALFITLMFMFNFYYVAEMSSVSFIGTYVMSYPICMDTVSLSIFNFVIILCLNIGVIFTVTVLKRFIRDLALIELCLLSGLAFIIQMAFARNKTSVYIAAASNFLSFSAFPFIRGYLSKRMGPREQGALFGGLILSETISTAILKVVTIYFYGATFKIFHGMVYLFLGLFSVVAIILTLFAIFLDRLVDEFGFSINKVPR